MPLELLRETYWIKLWQTPWGQVRDSKLRWFGVESSAEKFLADYFAPPATPADRADLESAFEFYPYELPHDIARILAAIAEHDPERAQRMRTNLFTADKDLTPAQQQFTAALAAQLQAANAPHRLVGENKWFAVYINDGGFHLDARVENLVLMPTPEDLATLAAPPDNLPYARAIRLLQDHPWLLEPAAGMEPLPGLSEII